jgi:hypothetical protein
MGRCQVFALGTATVIIAALMASSHAVPRESEKPAKLDNEVEHCRGLKEEQARKRCYEQEKSSASPSASQREPTEHGIWQLARTPNPAGGPDSISITKINDATGSDRDIAGLMLRCGEGATTEVLVVLVEPLRPRTHPKVTVVAGATTTEFIGSVVTSGALVLLPEKASALVEDAWQSIPELAVAIADNHRSLHGVIPLDDISTAMQTLQSNCPKAPHGR